jgi:DNA-binding MarR family transcriptional regulator
MSETAIRELHDHLERICNLLRGQARLAGAGLGLQPVQLDALHYLDLCNRYSDTPQAVTEYLGLTKGTVSQTLKVLEARGLVDKTSNPNDRRMVHLRVTAAGQALLARVAPAPLLRRATVEMPDLEVDGLVEGLRGLLRAVQQANGLKTFGVCATCRFNQEAIAALGQEAGRRCGLTGETLTDSDVARICREHEYPGADSGGLPRRGMVA